MDEPHRVCTKCRIHHVENCNTCAGFGFYVNKDGKRCMVNAQMAHDTLVANWEACPECGGTPAGCVQTKVYPTGDVIDWVKPTDWMHTDWMSKKSGYLHGKMMTED